MTTFNALVTREQADGSFATQLETLDTSQLPAGELLVKVLYSSLNYKDALSLSGNKGVTRAYPHTPGIDAVGEVVSCSNNAFATGSKVIITGYDFGMNTHGGLSQYIRVPAEWAVALPDNLTPLQAMSLGTGGFTAALCINALLPHCHSQPSQLPILVTGATGGVGSVAIQLLQKLGHSVVACSSKGSVAAELFGLDVANVIHPDQLLANNNRPMLKPLYAGVVDTVGGDILAAAIKSTEYGGRIAACGMAMSSELSVSVFPFILRGVKLLGIDSVLTPMPARTALWHKLATDWQLDLSAHSRTITLQQVPDACQQILQGKHTGRFVVDVQAQ